MGFQWGTQANSRSGWPSHARSCAMALPYLSVDAVGHPLAFKMSQERPRKIPMPRLIPNTNRSGGPCSVLLSQCGPADHAGASWPLRAGPPVDQCVKLLSYLHVQLHDTLVGLPLAAFLGSHREATVFLCIVENHEQLGFGIDHHGHALSGLFLSERPNLMIVQLFGIRGRRPHDRLSARHLEGAADV